jgi:predicted nucleic acid-binding protein
MTPVLLDTDVVHFSSRAIERWALLSGWQAKRIEWLRVFLGRFVVVPSSRDLVLKWAEVMVTARRNGRRLETADAWVAATAALHDAPLITTMRATTLESRGLK